MVGAFEGLDTAAEIGVFFAGLSTQHAGRS
jgi:hypothetical protein